MARAFKTLRSRVPNDDFAPGVRADRGIGDHTFGGAVPCHRVEALRIEAEQQNLVESRTVAHRIVGRIKGPSHRQLSAGRHIVRFQRFWRGAVDRDQEIPFAGSVALGIRLGADHTRHQGKAKASSIAARRRIRRTYQPASRFSGLIGVVRSCLAQVCPRTITLRALV